jgi:small subunit ribosomal protein S6
MVILDPTLSEEDNKAAVAKVGDLVSAIKGKVVGVEEWGKRKLAYDIKRHQEGYYVVYRFDASPESVSELERTLKISDPVLRFLVVRLEEKGA